MTRLLVSVRDADEALQATAGGADLIDLKEPTRGSLGAADPTVIRDVVDRLGSDRPTSAALGELLEFDPAMGASLPQTLSYAKLGLAGCAQKAGWQERLAQAFTALSERIARVAVVYADWPAAVAPPPESVLEQAVTLGCRAVLVDTYIKDGRGLLEHWRFDELADFVHAARSAGLLAVVGGGLNFANLARVMPSTPDYIAVRGAVCSGARTGRLDGRLVERLASEIRRFSSRELHAATPAKTAGHFG